MANLLMKGATLTDLSCPACSSPLFRLQDGTLWCENDQKKVVIVKETEESTRASNAGKAYDKLEETLLIKIQNMQTKIEKTEDPEQLQKLTNALSELLNSLEKINKMKKT